MIVATLILGLGSVSLGPVLFSHRNSTIAQHSGILARLVGITDCLLWVQREGEARGLPHTHCTPHCAGRGTRRGSTTTLGASWARGPTLPAGGSGSDTGSVPVPAHGTARSWSDLRCTHFPKRGAPVRAEHDGATRPLRANARRALWLTGLTCIPEACDSGGTLTLVTMRGRSSRPHPQRGVSRCAPRLCVALPTLLLQKLQILAIPCRQRVACTALCPVSFAGVLLV